MGANLIWLVTGPWHLSDSDMQLFPLPPLLCGLRLSSLARRRRDEEEEPCVRTGWQEIYAMMAYPALVLV